MYLQNWDDISDDDENENVEQTIKGTGTDVSEYLEEIMTLTPIGPPIESKQEIWRLDIKQQICKDTCDAIQLVEENLDDFYRDCAMMSAIVTGQNDEPKKFQEAWYYDDREKRKKWRTIIWKEFCDMISQGVWVNVNESSVPEGRKLIGSKWVFKEKHDGRFWARLVCLGYSQIPGIDLSDKLCTSWKWCDISSYYDLTINVRL